MPWSLGYLPVQEPERLDAFFLAVGKSLYLANGYEAKCRELLQLIRLVNALQDGNDIDAALSLCRAMKDKMLAGTLAELQCSPIARLEHIETLERAKDARNFIAHEGARLGHLSSVTARHLEARTARLRQEVSMLALGDNLVSSWLYEIGERKAPPLTIRNEYPTWIDDWVFGDDD